MNTIIGSLPEKMAGAYQVGKRIATLSGANLYHARHENGERVVLKQPQSSPLLPAQLSRFAREYELLCALDVEGIVKARTLAGEQTRPVIVLDYFDGESLETVLDRTRLEVSACLRLGAELAHTLADLHAAGIMHRDIRPANLWLTRHRQHLLLLDLSLASDTQGAASGDDEASGDWAYVSPEQTGRMNRPVDYRTDMYSLGVTLYRMLTGQLPFHGNDALEWAHSHIARLPQPPAEVNAAIPQAVSDIVMKLLAKMPEDRYQSGYGLCHDLETCLAQWEKHGAIAPFSLGSQDVPERLQIPQKLVGRAVEIQQLLTSFDAMAASGRATLLLISGAAGIGKSALVHELRQPIMDRGGYFICGKFDQYQRDIPYATVTQAFRELVQQILAESEARIADWRRQIQEAVGGNGQLIVDVLPQVELIIGKQELVPELPPSEAQNRFRLVFEKFIGVFAQQAHPLTLFLDDLQWADTASLRLIRELLDSSGGRFLLVIGAYRDNEVGPTHPLTLTLDDMRKEGTPIMQLALAPLSETTLGAYIGAMLQCEHDAAAPLAHLIYQKTAGNPFFVIQFITAVIEERMVVYDAAARTWRWDPHRISAKGYTDNVAELMVDKLTRLPAPAQTALQWLACLGSSAPEAMLVTRDQPKENTQAALSAAVRAGLILRAPGTIRFLHDRVREAAYLAIPADERAALHLQIGRLLLAGKTQAQIEEAVFAIVDQFNRGVDCITDANERALLCHLNFLAGKKAKASIAYASARSFLDRAMALLPSDAWRTQYQHAFALTLALSECEYLVGKFERAEQLANLILSNAQSNRDRARVYRLRLQLYQMAGRSDDAMSIMFEAVRLFGVIFPVTGPEIETAIDAEIGEISGYLQGRRIADIANAAPLTDADIEMVIALLVEAIPSAYGATQPDYYPLIIAMAVKLSLRYGHTEDSCNAYSWYGIILISRIGDVSAAFEFSEMALQLNQKLDGHRRKGRLLSAHAFAFSSWKNHISSVTPILDQAYAACLEVGDLLMANTLALSYFWGMLQQGVVLNAVLDKARKQGAFARDSHNDAIYQVIRSQQQLVANLKGQTCAPASMDDNDFDESECLAVLEKMRFRWGIRLCYIAKQVSAFIYGDYASALASAQQAALRESHEAGGMILVDSAHHFYFALTLAALYPQVSGTERRRFAGMLAKELDLHKSWADRCPRNFLNSYALVGAEIARIEGREHDAERLYEQAIHSARENGFIQNEAIAFELASAFYRARGFELIADTYLREALAGYTRWGADGKVAQLEVRYPQLRTQPASASILAAGRAAVPLDVMSVTKASQAISSRIVLNELVDTLLHIVLENAGAQTGCLLLCGSEGLEFAAEANVDQGVVQMRFYDRQAPDETSLPAAILNYVRRSRQQVLLPDVAQSHPFSTDAYFTHHHPKSVLCLPILRQDALIGLLYLENNLVTHAFAPERVAVLKLLAAQAAISLENALLYTDLQQENGERKRAEAALRKAHDELEMRVRERTAELNESNHHLRDEIFERQQAEADLARSNAELEQLAYVASHDLQEPLRMVASYLQLLEQRYEKSLDADAHEFIGFAVNGAKRMQSLIDDLLTYSRIGTRTMPLQPVDCAAAMATALHSLRMAIAEGDARITCGRLPVVMADVTQLVQLFQNLLANAIKFLREKPVRIHIAAERDGEFWRFSVQDSGIGIAPEYFERIFVMFQRLHSQRLYAGTGIGLAICKKIVERHGGRIWVESVPGQGSTFYFTLPEPRENAQ